MVDPINNPPSYTPNSYQAHKRNSWGAIFGGSVIALAVQLLLATFGMAIGLSTIAVSTEEETAKGVGIGAAIWWLISALAALFVGGFVAGRLCGFKRRWDGLLHGALTWALVTLASIVLLTTALGSIIGGAWNVMQTGATVASKASEQATPEQREQANNAAQQATTQAKEVANQAPEKAKEVAEKAKGPSVAAAWSIFLMLLLGLGAAAIGGATGAKACLDCEEETEFRRRT